MKHRKIERCNKRKRVNDSTGIEWHVCGRERGHIGKHRCLKELPLPDRRSLYRVMLCAVRWK